jgi:hypothetical protein
MTFFYLFRYYRSCGYHPLVAIKRAIRMMAK